MNVYILTFDKNIHIIEGLQYCINKYWKPNPNVILLGYKKPEFDLKDNFKFVSLGKDRGSNYVGGDLISFFTDVEDEHFIFSVDDFFPIRNIDIKLLNYLTNKMISDNSISRIALTGQIDNGKFDKIYSLIDKFENYNIIELSQNSNYRKSSVWSMWSKDYFLEYLQPEMSLWKWERDEKCKDSKYRVLGTSDNYVLKACHLYKHGKLKTDWFKDSENSDTMLAEDHSVISDIIY